MGMTWRDRAYCLGSSPSAFYEAIWPDDEPMNLEALGAAAATCAACPVRRECALSILEDEKVVPADERLGFIAFMTPLQRDSIARRDTIRCKCGYVRDPMDLVLGRLHCPKCKIDRQVPGVPAEGDGWKRRHTTLARKVVAHLVDEIGVGDTLPRPTHLARKMGVRIHDMTRVYEALVADGTLIAGNGSQPRYVRSDKAAAIRKGEWTPLHLATE